MNSESIYYFLCVIRKIRKYLFFNCYLTEFEHTDSQIKKKKNASNT